ncbi:MAG: T9SS type A sorting domain-containing protein [Saprospiraceae bacterium]|nr:T9SS type A sorting domain-containing protein [Saprospiraceae bacterium]
MNKVALILSSCPYLFLLNSIQAQQFRNGDFENVNAQSCVFNLSDKDFNKRMAYVYAFGKNNTGRMDPGQIDIHTFDCFVDPQSNKFCIGLAGESYTGLTSDAVALELDKELEPGEMYALRFYLFGNTTNHDTIAEVYIGESLSDTLFGIFIDTAFPQRMTWVEVHKIFKATQNSKYITIKNKVGHRSWNQIDNFRLTHITKIDDKATQNSDIYLFPNPAHGLVQIKNLIEPLPVKIEIYDSNGRLKVVYQTMDFDISGLEKGIYIVKIYSEHKLYLKRLIVN